MGLDIATIANLGSSGIMSVLFFFIIRWFLGQATKSMARINKNISANTLILAELYKLNLVDSATRKGVANGDNSKVAREAYQVYKNLLKSMENVEQKIENL